MKKNLLWTLAAILTSGLALTACSVEDNPNPNPAGGVLPTVVDFEDEDASAFQVADAARMTLTVVDDETNGTKVAQFVRSGSGGFGFAAYQLPDMENATQAKVSFDFSIPAEILGQSAIAIGDATVHNAATGGFNTTSGQYGYGTNGAIFYLGAYRGKAYGGGNENYFQINGAPAAASQEEHAAAEVWGKWFHVDLDVNVAEKTLSYSITTDGEEWWAGEEVPFVSENANTLTQLSVFVGYSGTYKLDNVSVTKVKSDASIKYADYTIEFVDTEGNPLPEDIKTTITRRGKVGDAITLTDADKANTQNADGSIKYNYVSDNSADAVITEEGTVVTVVYEIKEAAKYKWLLNVFAGPENTAANLILSLNGEEFEGVKTTKLLGVTYAFNGKYYSTTPSTWNGKEITFTGQETKLSGYCVQTQNYALDESIVYFGECEDLEQEGEFGTPFSQGTFNRISQGKSAQPLADAKITTGVIPAGTYNVGIYGRCDGGSGDENDVLYILSADGTLTKVEGATPATWASANMGWITFADVTFKEGDKLVIWNNTAGTKNSYDCIKVYIPAE